MQANAHANILRVLTYQLQYGLGLEDSIVAMMTAME